MYTLEWKPAIVLRCGQYFVYASTGNEKKMIANKTYKD